MTTSNQPYSSAATKVAQGVEAATRQGGQSGGFLASFLQGVGGVASGAARSVADLGLFVWDVATSDLTRDENQSFWDQLSEISERRLGMDTGVGAHLFGPDLGVGAVAREAAPQTKEAFEQFVELMDEGFTGLAGDSIASVGAHINAMHNVVTGDLPAEDYNDYLLDILGQRYGRPIDDDEAFLRQIPGASLVMSLFDDEEDDLLQREEGTSPGHYLFTGYAGVDLTDPQEVAAWVGTDAYKYGTGFIDAGLRLAFDPDILAGKAAKVARLRTFHKPLVKAEDYARTFGKGSQWQSKVLPDLEKMSEAEFLSKYLKDHVHGAEVTTFLKRAHQEGGADGATTLMRAFAGDKIAIETFAEQHRIIADDLKRLVNEQEALVSRLDQQPRVLPDGTAVTATDMQRVDRLQEAITEQGKLDDTFESLNSRVEHQNRTEELFGTIERESDFLNSAMVAGREVKSLKGMKRELATHAQHNETWQAGPFGKVVHVSSWLGEKKPGTFLRLDNPGSHEQVRRQLRDAKLSTTEREELLSRYMRATNASERASIYAEIEDKIVANLIVRSGQSVEDLEAILAPIRAQRQQSWGLMENTRANRMYDGKGRGTLRYVDENGHVQKVALPLYVTQEANVVPMVNVALVEQATKNFGRLRLTNKVFRTSEAALDGVTRAWKTSTLLRPAWATRTILLDEQFRALAKIAALAGVAKESALGAQMKFVGSQFSMGLPNLVSANRAHSAAVKGRKSFVDRALTGAAEAKLKKVERGSGLEGLLRRFNPENGDLAYDFLQLKHIPGFKWMDGAERGPKALTVDGTEFSPAWSKGDESEIIQRLISSRASFDAFVGRTEQSVLGKVRNSGDWRSMSPDAADYFVEWEKRLNMQIGQDAVMRKILEGQSSKEIKQWLFSTKEGRDYFNRIESARYRMYRSRQLLDENHNPIDGGVTARTNRWLTEMWHHAKDYTAGFNPNVVGAALRGKVSRQVLEMADSKPVIHGEVLNQVMGRGEVMKVATDVVDSLMQRIGTLPTDKLLREPLAAEVYKSHVKFAVTRAREQGRTLDQKAIDTISRQARHKTVKEVQDLMFDFADQGKLEHVLRYAMPFFGAWQEAIVRWAGIATANPTTFGRARQIVQAPGKSDYETMGIAEWQDDQGNNMISFALPDIARKIPGLGHARNVSFNKAQLNLITEGPGFGFMVTLPVNELVKGKPQLEDAVKFILPYGTTDRLDQVLPSAARRMKSYFGKESDRSYVAAMGKFWQIEMTRYEQGLRDDIPSKAEIKKRADNFFMLRAFAGGILPAQPQFPSPYKMYEDILRNMREEDPATADERFIEEVGEEFWALTQSVSRSNVGVPPTLEGWELWQNEDVRRMVAENPDLASLVVNGQGMGALSRMTWGPNGDQPIPPQDARKAEVLRVIDGDTLEVREAGGQVRRVRMLSVNAPEMKTGGKAAVQAKDRLAQLAPVGSSVTLAFQAAEDRRKVDAYSRDLAQVWGADGTWVNGEQLKMGWVADDYNKRREFNPSVYNAQFSETISDEADTPIREIADYADWEADGKRKMGWMEYSQAMEYIDAMRVQQGLPNYQVADAAHLAEAKRAVVEYLKDKYSVAIPGSDQKKHVWYEDFRSMDQDRKPRLFKGFYQLISDPMMQRRQDMQALRVYLAGREAFAQELAARAENGGAISMDATDNMDLAQAWQAYALRLVEQVPGFAELYHRYFERDLPSGNDFGTLIPEGMAA